MPFPPPGDLLDPGIKSMSNVSPALQVDSLPAEQWGGHTLRGYVSSHEVPKLVCFQVQGCIFITQDSAFLLG